MASNPAGASRLQSLRPVRRVAELGSLGGSSPRALMTQRHKGVPIRWTLFAVFSVVCFVLLSPFIYRPRVRTSASVTLSDVGVTIQSGDKPGTTYVKVDDREEIIPRGQEDSSALYREATQRIASSTHLG